MQTEVDGIEMETLRKQIDEYVNEINQLKNVVQKLSHENIELKTKFSTENTTSITTTTTTTIASTAMLTASPTSVTTISNNFSVYDEPL